MRILSITVAILLLATAPLPANAQKQSGPPLPRVLIIGDSIYSSHTRELSKVFKNKVQITYAT